MNAQSTWYVDAAAVPPGNGSQASPFVLIQDAIAAATSGDLVEVAGGTYFETEISFMGKGISLVSAAPAGSAVLELNGNGRAFRLVNGEAGARISGFTIRNGAPSNGTCVPENGGAILCSMASLVIENSTFLNCRAEDGCDISGGPGGNGGAISAFLGSLTLDACVFTQNGAGTGGQGLDGGAGGSGGVLFAEGTQVTIRNCEFTGNFAGAGPNVVGRGGRGGGGGALRLSTTTSSIESCVFIDNEAGDGGSGSDGEDAGCGGAVCTSNSQVTISNSVFWGNEAGDGGSGGIFRGSGGQGGGAAIIGGACTLVESLFAQNRAGNAGTGSFLGGGGWGGGISADVLNAERCQFFSNVAGLDPERPEDSGRGGGVAATNLYLSQSLVVGNYSGGSAGGVHCQGWTIDSTVFHANSAESLVGGLWGLATVSNCTFYDNQVLTLGPAAAGAIAGNANAMNCIVWGNTFPQLGAGVLISSSDVQGGAAGVGNFDLDPLFVDAANGDLRLATGSPCIDSGVDGLATSSTDPDENPRLLDGDLDGLMTLDRGAYEFNNARLELAGEASPGGSLLVQIDSTFAAPAFLALGTAEGSVTCPPLGSILFGLSAPYVLLDLGQSPPFQASIPIPQGLVLPQPLIFQALVRDPASGTGSLSNAVEAGAGPAPLPPLSPLPPVISSLSTPSAAPGSPVTVYGAYFTPSATVEVGEILASSVFLGPSQIQFTVPFGIACDTIVQVTIPGVGVASAAFNLIPQISSISLSSGVVAGGEMMTVSGNHFSAGTSVTIGGLPANVTTMTATLITLFTPPGSVGPTSLVVTSPGGCSAATNFSYFMPPPVISSVTPSSALPGTLIGIAGSGFDPGLGLVVGGLSVTPLSVAATYITFTMPTGVGCDVTIVVTNPDAQSDSVAFNEAPFVSFLAPATGPAAGGVLLGIAGGNFLPGTAVTIGGTPATITAITDTAISLVTPPGSAGPAPVVITTPAGCTVTATYTYL